MRDDSQNLLASFFDFGEGEAAALEIVDRSTIERYTVCPAQARYLETGAVNWTHAAMASGEAVHRALGRSLTEYIDAGGEMTPMDLEADVMNELYRARPDIQPDALSAARGMAWSWSRLVGSIHPENILAYDGGSERRSGQLGWDIPDLGLRLTSELDLLYAGRAPQLLHEIDYKTGWAKHSAASVSESFQFQMHAWLVLHNYPEVEALEVRVWNTRSRRLTLGVEFDRQRDLPQINARIRSAAELYRQHAATPAEQAETWPLVDRCAACPVAARCPAAGQDAADLASDPGAYIDQLTALEARVSAMKKQAGAYVDASRADIVSASGNAFGREKPKTTRAVPKGLYSTSGTEAEETE